MQYDLNQLRDAERFQRLVNAILTARFGQDVRLTPLRGQDGGRDGETARNNPYMEYVHDPTSLVSTNPLVSPPRPGRYVFQAKYHRMGEQRPSTLRGRVIQEFKNALNDVVLGDRGRGVVNYFFLVTNVTSSKYALDKTDEVRQELLADHRQLHADIWWGESITTSLDWAPDLWLAFPELFPGGVPPLLVSTHSSNEEALSRTFRVATTHQYRRDLTVKFRQIELEQQLFDLFVDLDARIHFDDTLFRSSFANQIHRRYAEDPSGLRPFHPPARWTTPPTALQLLIDDGLGIRRILLEGGPGQGKSTVTQMAAQVYRQKVLGLQANEDRVTAWHQGCRLRVPIRIELGDFARWLANAREGTLEEYIGAMLGRDAGGASVTVEDVSAWVERSSVILLLDGLDEIGNDSLRDRAIDAIMATIGRFEEGLDVDLRVVLTTRPPAVVGRRNKLDGFTRAVIAPMDGNRIDDYLGRWLQAQITTEEERVRIRHSFEGRRYEPHVDALARNPMQMSVLLQFIYLKGEAFPDRRAELYRDYFQIVIDRDVEKSPELAQNRDLVEGLHSFLGFRIHGMTELEEGRRSLDRNEIVRLAGQWLVREGHSSKLADRYFALGEERFGLIVARSGEGRDTNYGFEVQPIQEYFAASYISNRLTDGKAPEVFQLLIHRSYWREVAIFLAGLRRPNEKPDLIARARAADRDSRDALRPHDGKGIVLQLLLEGVVTQPRHVLLDAMSFVMEILDVEALRLYSAPQVLVRDLAEVCRCHGDETTSKHIANVVRACSESEDKHLLGLVHRLAAEALPEEQYVGLVRQYAGRAGDALAIVRVTSPYRSPSTLERLGASDGYWQGIPMRILARRVWRSALWHGTVPDVPYLRRMHLGLILQFAIGGLADRRRAIGLLETRGDDTLAIWKLQQNVQAIRVLLSSGEKSNAFRIRDVKDYLGDVEERDDTKLYWDNGLDEPLAPEIERTLRDLIRASNGVVAALCGEDQAAIRNAVLMYIDTVRAHLLEAGIAGWIACRCAVEMLDESNIVAVQQMNVVPSAIDDMRREAVAYYDSDDIRSFAWWHYHELWLLGMPLGVRASRGGALRPLEAAIADVIRGQAQLAGERGDGWLEDISIPRVLLRPLADAFHDEPTELLRFLGRRDVTGQLVGRRLMVQGTRRILKICRNTDDMDTLRGAAMMLANATFGRITEAELLVKVLAAAPGSELVDRVFGRRRANSEGRRMEAHELELAQEAARLILQAPEERPFHIVNRAAVFLRETNSGGSTPLFEAHGDLLGLGAE